MSDQYGWEEVQNPYNNNYSDLFHHYKDSGLFPKNTFLIERTLKLPIIFGATSTQERLNYIGVEVRDFQKELEEDDLYTNTKLGVSRWKWYSVINQNEAKGDAQLIRLSTHHLLMGIVLVPQTFTIRVKKNAYKKYMIRVQTDNREAL